MFAGAVEREAVSEAVRIKSKQPRAARNKVRTAGGPCEESPRGRQEKSPRGRAEVPRHISFGGYPGSSHGVAKTRQAKSRFRGRSSRFPSFPVARTVEGAGAKLPRPPLVRETGLRTGPRRSTSVQCKDGGVQNTAEKCATECYECGQEGHFKVKCPRRAGN